jgi:A/G-specific adenine glycosylase
MIDDLVRPKCAVEIKNHQDIHHKLIVPLLNWFSANARDLPWRRNQDAYGIWISEVMLQQTQVSAVIPYWERWMTRLADVQRLARARSQTIHRLWAGLGYYSRVRNLQAAARVLVREHGGKLPSDYETLLQLPGVGRYTAGALCSIAFGQPKPVVDGNVVRVLTRVFGIEGDPRRSETREALWGLAERLVRAAEAQPSSRLKSLRSQRGQGRDRRGGTARGNQATSPCSAFNQGLMELGALVCTPRRPQCCACPLSQTCIAHQQRRMEAFPNLPKRPRATHRRFVAFILRRGDRLLVRQRPAGEVNAHLWEFPNTELGNGSGDAIQAAREVLGKAPAGLQKFCTIKHSITRYRITLDVFEAGGVPLGRAGKWVSPAALRRLPFSSAHAKILRRVSA